MIYFFKRYFLFQALFILPFVSGAWSSDRAPYRVHSEVDSAISKNHSPVLFSLNDYTTETVIGATITAESGSTVQRWVTGDNGKASCNLIPGTYKLTFTYMGFDTVEINNLEINRYTRYEIEVDFKEEKQQLIYFKPVIYLYPETKTAVDIELNIDGDFLFTYPTYDKGWHVTAEANGTITHNNKTYNYLFWEGTGSLASHIDKTKGFIVEQKDLLTFFETNLEKMGLNSKEQQDFITFWYPRMMHNEKNFIHFVFNEDYNRYANLNVIPKPDNLIRIYMVFAAVSSEKKWTVTEQTFPAFSRKGFTLVEWGGSQLPVTMGI